MNDVDLEPYRLSTWVSKSPPTLARKFLFALVKLRMQLVHRPLDVTLRCWGSKAASAFKIFTIYFVDIPVRMYTKGELFDSKNKTELKFCLKMSLRKCSKTTILIN
jgi:hypothetical protein